MGNQTSQTVGDAPEPSEQQSRAMQSDSTGEVDTHSSGPPQEEGNDQQIVPAPTDRTETTDVEEPHSIRAFHYFSDVVFRHRPNSRSLRTSTFVFVDVAKDHAVEYEIFEGLPRPFKRRGIGAVEKSKGTSMPELARMSFNLLLCRKLSCPSIS